MNFKEKHTIEINSLFEIVSNYINDKFQYKITSIDQLVKKTRKKPYVYMRRLMMVILAEKFLKDGYNQEDIASVVMLDRTSFIYHSKNHIDDYSTYSSYKEEYDFLVKEFSKKIKV